MMWNIQLCIAAAVRRNRLVGKVTRSEVESVVKLWLRYAADRSGGRHARKRRAASTQHELPDSDVSEWQTDNALAIIILTILAIT